MTISILYEPDVYSGNGTLDTFPATFDFLSNGAYLKVSLKNETTLVYTDCSEHLQYEVVGANVVFNTGYIPTTNDLVIIEFYSDWLQNSDYVENSSLPAENMEDDFDKLKLEVQALRDLTARSLRIGPDADLSVIDPTDYFDVALAPDIAALAEQSDALLALAADQADLTDIAANWTPASTSGAASLRFKEDSDNGTSGVYIKGPASLSGDVTITLPDNDGDASQVLTTDGAGNTSWTTVSSGAAPGGAGSNTQVIVNKAGNLYSCSYFKVSGTASDSDIGDVYGTSFHAITSLIVGYPLAAADKHTGSAYFYNATHNGYCQLSVHNNSTGNVIFKLPSNSGFYQGVLCYDNNSSYWATAAQLWSFIVNEFTFFSAATTIAPSKLYLHEATTNGTNKITLKTADAMTNSYEIIFPATPGYLGDVIAISSTGALEFKSPASLINFYAQAGATTSAVIGLFEATDNGVNYIGLRSPAALAATISYVLPGAHGNASEVLIENGSGVLSWSDANILITSATDVAQGKIELAVQSEMETGTDETRAVTPGRQHFHPSASKAWFYSADMSAGTIIIDKSYNIASVTDNGTGDYTITIDADFSSSAFAAVATASTTAGTPLIAGATIIDAYNVKIKVTDNAGTATDANVLSVIMFGDL